MGKEASAYNKQLVEGKFVTLVRDVSDTDRYGRWLRYVYVDGVFVNEVLVANGFANVVTYPPDVKYTEQLRRVEQDAREARRGLWGSECEVWVAPTAPPTSPPPTHHVVPNTSCVVKGNINSKGEKIFHVPGCQSYEKTVINEAAGEQWFCSESEALAAGWRRALNCQ
jgi:micrococcal nuclease